MPNTVTNTLLTNAMLEINVNDPADAPAQTDSDFVLGKLNRLLDNWNAERHAIYADQFLPFTINIVTAAAGLPQTIGIAANSPTWTVTGNRPVSIEGITVILSGTPKARVNLRPRDSQWWQLNTVPTITSPLPTDFYYNPVYPNGEVWLWPEPTTAYAVQVWCRGVLSSLTQFATFDLPPGYEDAITLTLAEDCAGGFQKPVTPELRSKALQARARIFDNNTQVPKLRTRDSGMPRSQGGVGFPNFFWPTGGVVGK